MAAMGFADHGHEVPRGRSTPLLPGVEDRSKVLVAAIQTRAKWRGVSNVWRKRPPLGAEGAWGVHPDSALAVVCNHVVFRSWVWQTFFGDQIWC